MVNLEDPYPSLFIITESISLTILFYSLGGVFLVLLLLLSALISGSEVAFFSLSSEEVSICQHSKESTDQKLIRLLRFPKRLLATILILNNMINVAIVTLSTFIMWETVGSKVTGGLIITLLTFIVTTAIVFFGEVIPKVYANQNNLSFARRTAPFINFAFKLFTPFSWILMKMSSLIESQVNKRGYQLSTDELHQAIEITTKDDETTTEEEKDILKGIVNFGKLNVTQVMRSRLDITAIDIEDNFHELMDRINKTGFSRIPIYEETIDNISGILYIKDLLPFTEKDENFNWQRLIRPGFFIPESKKVDALLRDFQDKRVHLAIVVDEYGGTSGLITLEDLIEEIVGEINDEFDDESIIYNKLDENTYIFEGKISLNDFCKTINEDISIFDEVKGESESLGGLLLEITSKIPRIGEKIQFDRFIFTVVAVDARRIKRIRVFISNSNTQKQTMAI
ncbi:gliding motility-associated protein GldE [Xanthovirga aplysinae]|uniref:gliding motility-associated protein GldE n=1 Tax=Xanthovirga aplysinae TaxID=2529853 RepID=UPI001656E430|nr:gliding motility-associated protein GldE [Xanthovirga aplysinae]